MIDIARALESLGAKTSMTGNEWSGVKFLPESPLPHPTEQEVNDEIARLDTAAVTEAARIEDTKNDAEGMAFLNLMKSKTSAQRKDWLSSNVADPNVRKVLQGLMSLVLWKVA